MLWMGCRAASSMRGHRLTDRHLSPPPPPPRVVAGGRRPAVVSCGPGRRIRIVPHARAAAGLRARGRLNFGWHCGEYPMPVRPPPPCHGPPHCRPRPPWALSAPRSPPARPPPGSEGVGDSGRSASGPHLGRSGRNAFLPTSSRARATAAAVAAVAAVAGRASAPKGCPFVGVAGPGRAGGPRGSGALPTRTRRTRGSGPAAAMVRNPRRRARARAGGRAPAQWPGRCVGARLGRTPNAKRCGCARARACEGRPQIRINNGNVECMSSDGVNCLWGGPCQELLRSESFRVGRGWGG